MVISFGSQPALVYPAGFDSPVKNFTINGSVPKFEMGELATSDAACSLAAIEVYSDTSKTVNNDLQANMNDLTNIVVELRD